MIRTGIDIVQINRIEKILNKKRIQFYKKIFTNLEIDYIEKRGHSPSTVAGLFASKEAVSKALGTGIGKISWQDIEVDRNQEGRPRINIGEKLRKKLEEEGLNSIDISISHERDYAVASAICFFDPGVEDKY